MKNALLPGLGGPMGRHARPEGTWFNPLPWTILVSALLFVVLAVRQVPCVQTDATNAIDGFIRLCYSDIPLMWTGQEFGLGQTPFTGEGMVFPPVLGVLLLATIRVTGWLGADIRPDADVQVQLDGAQIFYAVTMVMLFVFFLVWVVSTAMTGRGSEAGRRRTWDGMLVAASPVVLAAGLINWDILPIGLAALGLWQFAQGRVPEAAIILALAAGAGTMAILVVVAVAVAILLRGRLTQLLVFLACALGTFVLVHIPLLLNDFGVVRDYYRAQFTGEKSYGSVWLLLQSWGVDVRAAGSLGLLIMLLFLGVMFAVMYLKRLRPRVGTLVGITVFVSAITGAAFSPQTALWLLFALVVARPFRLEMVLFSIVQVGYYLAIWGWISGHLTEAKNGPEGLYFLAIGLRLAVEAWLLWRFLTDVFNPRGDAIREPDNSDPLGGVLTVGEKLVRIPDEDLVTVA